MAQIPLGNFDQVSVQAPVQTGSPDLSGALAGSRAKAQLGEQVAGMAQQGMQIHQQREAEEQAKRDALKRVDMGNAAADYELSVASEQQAFSQDLADGKVDFHKAGDEWNERLNKLGPPTPPANLDEVMTAQFGGMVQQTQKRATLAVGTGAARAAAAHYEAATVDTQQKIVTLANVTGNAEEAVARNHALLPGFRAAGYDEAKAAEMVDKADKQIWGNEVKTRVLAGGNSIEQLQAIQQDLVGEKGRYLDKLDPTTRLSFADHVATQIDQLNAAAAHDKDKRETIAQGVVKDVVAQAASGIIPTPDALQAWSTSVAGTSQEGAYRQALAVIDEVQTVRRLPGPQQEAWLQAQEVKLNTQGGSPQDLSRLNTVRTVIAKDQKQREDQPLLYLQNMTGKPPAPIDLSSVQGGDFSAFGVALADRLADVKTLGKSGYRVNQNLLLPAEQDAVTNLLNVMPPDKLNAAFGAIRAAVGSDEAYNAVMHQVAPGAPLKAYAGELAVRPGGKQVSSLILRGEALLNGGKDGKPKWPMPPDNKFQEAFLARAGNAYQGRPEALQNDLQAARAVYAASAAQDGASADGDEFNGDRFDNAMRAVGGDIAEVGGAKVTVPWGVSASDFTDQVAAPMRGALKAAGLDPDASGVGLMATPLPGRYVLVQGRSPIWNPTATRTDGRPMPLYIDFEPQPPEVKTGRPDSVVRHR